MVDHFSSEGGADALTPNGRVDRDLFEFDEYQCSSKGAFGPLAPDRERIADRLATLKLRQEPSPVVLGEQGPDDHGVGTGIRRLEPFGQFPVVESLHYGVQPNNGVDVIRCCHPYPHETSVSLIVGRHLENLGRRVNSKVVRRGWCA